jgi:hypothetical protein
MGSVCIVVRRRVVACGGTARFHLDRSHALSHRALVYPVSTPHTRGRGGTAKKKKKKKKSHLEQVQPRLLQYTQWTLAKTRPCSAVVMGLSSTSFHSRGQD